MSEPASANPSETEALETLWAERGISPSSLRDPVAMLGAKDRRLTVNPETTLLIEASIAPNAGSPSPQLVTGEPVTLSEELGRGGMGVVFLGTQPSMRRQVAVKAPIGPSDGPALFALLKEAWVAASLGHPNLVPVHSLAPHPYGVAVVMKRIEGRNWRDLILDDALLPEEERPSPLEFHLRVLMKVCDAIGFAHSRQVLHLDLKPENVMIGSFGEVYVVDWGLAAGLPNAPEWLARASAINNVSGTPSYMSPELALGDGLHVDERTDVYLLAGILHEVVCHRPPHDAPEVMERLHQAFRSEPQVYPGVADGLVAILHRGLAREPDSRYASVEAFRTAIADYLSSREADELVNAARGEVEALKAELARPGPSEAAVQGHVGAARYAIRTAISLSPQHGGARALEDQLHERVAHWALDVGRLDLAESCIRELWEEHPVLRHRLSELREGLEARKDRVHALEQLATERSLHIRSGFRRALAIGFGLLFFVVNSLMGWAERTGAVAWNYDDMYVTGGLILVGAALFVAWKRKSVFSSRVNADLFYIFLTGFVLVQAHWIVAAMLGVPFTTALVLSPIYYSLSFGAVAVLVERRFFWSGLVSVSSLLLASAFPAWAYEFIGAGGFIGASLLGLLWRVRPPTSPVDLGATFGP